MKLETKVGAFFFGTILVLGVLVLRVEKMELGSKNHRAAYHTHFRQVAGLSLQSAVRIAGVKVGTVRAIEIEGGRARVTFALTEDVPVYRDAVAHLSSIGILGEKYIELDSGKPETGALASGQAIASKAEVSLDGLLESVAAIATDLKGITTALNQSIGGEHGRQKLDEIVDNIRVLTAEFRTMAQENHGAINTTMANAQAISGELRDRLPQLAKEFETLGRNLNALVTDVKPEFTGLAQDVRKLAGGFQATSENIRQITDKLNKGEGTIGKLLTDEATIQKINTAVDNVNDMLGGMKNMELRMDLYGHHWSKRGDSRIGLGVDIVPRHDYWYALELNSTPDGKIMDSTRTTTRIDPQTGLPVEVPEKIRTVIADNATTVSAQFAKRLGENLVLTAGFVEGKGGLGAEFRAAEDRFRMGALAYDFTKRDDKPKPRYRFTTSYQFWRGLYGTVGVQDIANKDLRSFFFGGGIRWKDEDLKKLVGLAGAAK